jgi:hypothetical protein
MYYSTKEMKKKFPMLGETNNQLSMAVKLRWYWNKFYCSKDIQNLPKDIQYYHSIYFRA